MVDYQQSQYPIYDHHYQQGHITPDHVHPSWYTPPLGDFGLCLWFQGGASTSFGLGAQEEGDNDEEDNDEGDEEDEEGYKSDD